MPQTKTDLFSRGGYIIFGFPVHYLAFYHGLHAPATASIATPLDVHTPHIYIAAHIIGMHPMRG